MSSVREAVFFGVNHVEFLDSAAALLVTRTQCSFRAEPNPNIPSLPCWVTRKGGNPTYKFRVCSRRVSVRFGSRPPARSCSTGQISVSLTPDCGRYRQRLVRLAAPNPRVALETRASGPAVTRASGPAVTRAFGTTVTRAFGTTVTRAFGTTEAQPTGRRGYLRVPRQPVR